MRRRTAFFLLTLALGAFAAAPLACTEAMHDPSKSDAGDAGDASDEASATPDGDVETDGQTKPTSITLKDACATLAKAQCTRLATCATDLAVQERYGTEEACEAAVNEKCLLDGKAADAAKPIPKPEPKPSPADASADADADADAGEPVDAGPPPIDGTAIASCAAAIGTQQCVDFLVGAIPAACVRKGRFVEGDACGTGAQCASGFCDVPADRKCGKCKAPPAADVTCNAASECPAGFTCWVERHQCVPFAKEGKACYASLACEPGFSCVVQQDGGTIGTCTKGALEKAACDPTLTTGPDCNTTQGLYCNSAKTCARKQVAFGPTDICGDYNDSRTVCAASGQCAPISGQTFGGCVSAIAVNEPCDPASGPPCAAPARCLANRLLSYSCTIPDPLYCH
jgi:hypothetical protein